MITLRKSRPTRQDDIVPMINVAFLLLIFFLMSAVIAPPAPIEFTAPSASEPATTVEGTRFYVTAGGELVGEDGLIVPSLSDFAGKTVTISADASLAASDFVRIVENLRIAGITEIHLIARSDFE
jgi:biopolymer transport protein ExbD